jgi:hypothetical protein
MSCLVAPPEAPPVARHHIFKVTVNLMVQNLVDREQLGLKPDMGCFPGAFQSCCVLVCCELYLPAGFFPPLLCLNAASSSHGLRDFVHNALITSTG